MKKSVLIVTGFLSLLCLDCGGYRSANTLDQAATSVCSVSDSAHKQDSIIASSTLTTAGQDSLRDTTTDTLIPVPLPMVMVAPPILYGEWRGRDSATGREITVSFIEGKSDQPIIFSVTVTIGKTVVTGICPYFETNMCQLQLSTGDIQNIRTMWAFKYDGAWLTVQDIGGHTIGGVGSFRVQKQ